MAALRGAVEELYRAGIDRPKVAQWIAVSMFYASLEQKLEPELQPA